LTGNSNVLISPDGQISLLPLEILPRPDQTYVIESIAVSYLTSGRDLLRYGEARKPSGWALLLGDPNFDLSAHELAERVESITDESHLLSYFHAPSRGVSDCLDRAFTPLHYSGKELETIAGILQERGRLAVSMYRGGDALEEILKGISDAPRVLHLPTHGWFCEDTRLSESDYATRPLLRSGLALAGANNVIAARKAGATRTPPDSLPTEDGILTAFEVSGLDLVGTELTVLSACETGVGDARNGEGVFGLRRAFQHAGSRSILMSLWKVPDDETCRLMTLFYNNWLQGESKSDALRRSALELMELTRKKYGTAHPYFWGGFVLVGDPQ
jgi:CHAT domain-containing protein